MSRPVRDYVGEAMEAREISFGNDDATALMPRSKGNGEVSPNAAGAIGVREIISGAPEAS